MDVLELLLVLLLGIPPSVLQSPDYHTIDRHSPELLAKCIPYGTTFSQHIDRRTADRSVAPWTYIPHKVSDRIPETILIAKCDKKTCLNDSRLVVTPVNMTMPVFYRRHDGNTTRYHLVIERFSFTVGCTCIRLSHRTPSLRLARG